MKPPDSKDQFYYEGFSTPRFTQLPDDVVDLLMPELSEAELKVLLYIVRRTFGFGKDSDAISLNQMIDGITTRDGRVLDRGTGLSRSSVRRGVAGLESKGIIVIRKAMSEEGDYETNVYGLRFRSEQGVVSKSNHPSEGVVPQENHRGVNLERPVVSQQNLQETVSNKQSEQETDRSFETSNKPTSKIQYSEIREELLPFAEDFAREFKDEAPLRSSLSQMVNIFLQAEVEMDDYINLLYDARLRTKEYSGSVTKESSRGAYGGKNLMPYFFKVLRNLVEQERHQDSRAS